MHLNNVDFVAPHFETKIRILAMLLTKLGVAHLLLYQEILNSLIFCSFMIENISRNNFFFLRNNLL